MLRMKKTPFFKISKKLLKKQSFFKKAFLEVA
jgi:hypothetical protein